MSFARADQDFIRALVREEIALDEMRRLEQVPHSCSPPLDLIESAGAGVLPTAPAPTTPVPTTPAPTTIASTADFVAELLRNERDRRCDIEAVTVKMRPRGAEVRLIASGRSFTLAVTETKVMA